MTYAKSATLFFSRGKFTYVSEKESKSKTNEGPKSISVSHKEISGIKSSLKKDRLLVEGDDRFGIVGYKHALNVATRENEDAGGSKASAADKINPDYVDLSPVFDVEIPDDGSHREHWDFLSKQFLYIPAWGLCGSADVISIYLRGIMEFTENPDLNRYATRVILKYLILAMLSKSNQVISLANFKWNPSGEKKDFEYQNTVMVNDELYSPQNISQDLTGLSAHGLRVAKALYERFTEFANGLADQIQNVDHWSEVEIDGTGVEHLFDNLVEMSFDAFSKKTEGRFAEQPVNEKKIPHEKFLGLCRATGAFSTISFGKVPERLVKSSAGDSKKQVVYTFCDMNNDSEVNSWLLRFPLRIDGVASVTDGKVGGKVKGSTTASGTKSIVGYILDKYLDDAEYDGTDFKSDNTSFDEVVAGIREMDVTKDFIEGKGESGFRCSKITEGKKHVAMFSGCEPISRETLVYLADAYHESQDAEFWRTFVNLLKVTVKISSTRASAKTGTPSQTARERTLNFFTKVLSNCEYISAEEVMRSFIDNGKNVFSTTDL